MPRLNATSNLDVEPNGEDTELIDGLYFYNYYVPNCYLFLLMLNCHYLFSASTLFLQNNKTHEIDTLSETKINVLFMQNLASKDDGKKMFTFLCVNDKSSLRKFCDRF